MINYVIKLCRCLGNSKFSHLVYNKKKEIIFRNPDKLIYRVRHIIRSYIHHLNPKLAALF